MPVSVLDILLVFFYSDVYNGKKQFILMGFIDLQSSRRFSMTITFFFYAAFRFNILSNFY